MGFVLRGPFRLPGALVVLLTTVAPWWAGCSFPEYRTLGDSLARAHCQNRQKDADEVDYDCGGVCAACGTGQACLTPSDCASGVCLAGTCAAPNCSDGVKNGRESDVDCGEACSPGRCSSGNQCNFDDDCNSFRCQNGACAAASCSDGLRNGAESDLDCGGASCQPCAVGASCGADPDCMTRVCSAARCAPESCRNQQLDPGETDIDCGGSTCGSCRGGAACRVPADCSSGGCAGGVCDAASCSDGLTNQAETDVDCGDSGCAHARSTPRAAWAPIARAAFACSRSARSLRVVISSKTAMKQRSIVTVAVQPVRAVPCARWGADCASGVCNAEECAPARCDDGVKNGSESDVDCGKGCKPCELEQACVDGDDCATGACNAVCVSTVRVELQAGNRDAMPICIQPCFNFVNEGKSAIALKDLSIRYYYTKGTGQGAESYGCYWVNSGDCNQVAPALFADLRPQRASANRYVELRFNDAAKPLDAGQSFVLQGGFCLPDGKTFTQADDYSYNASATYQTSSKVVLFKGGVRIWGVEPP